MNRNIPKDLRKHVKAAQENGWELVISKGHPKLFKDGKGYITLPSTPSDHRGIKNAIATMKRLGALD